MNKLLVLVAENDSQHTALNQPTYQAGVRDVSRDKTRDVSSQGAAPQSKAESKRLQWERERGTSGRASHSQTLLWDGF